MWIWCGAGPPTCEIECVDDGTFDGLGLLLLPAAGGPGLTVLGKEALEGHELLVQACGVRIERVL